MTTKEDIRGWLKRGIRDKQTHVIVVCDSFDYSDYPVFVDQGEDARRIAAKFDGQNMQRVMEVYDLSLPIEDQINEKMSFHY